MAREMGKLTARTVSALLQGKVAQVNGLVVDKARAQRIADGANLYLRSDGAGTWRWVFAYQRAGRAREIGFGSVRTVSLARARALARAAHDLLAQGGDPRDVRKPAGVITFGAHADALVKRLEPGWRNAKHAAQWASTLTVHAKALRDLPIDKITTADVLSVIAPLWTTKPETAARLRGRIERVLDDARAHHLRTGENPAAWRLLRPSLPDRAVVKARGHHAAMPFADVPAFMARLRERTDVGARALEFTILTAARTGETIGAEWTEFDLDARTWTVPASRMKAGVAHAVPLSDRALEILRSLPRSGRYVFPGAKAGKPLSNMALTMTLRRLEIDATVHGFRSSFRDWASEVTNFANHVVEMALAHVVKDKVEAAYRRGDLFAKRAELMAAWDRYCAQTRGKVIRIHAGASNP